MRIRILKTVYYDGKNHYHAGDVVDIPDKQAKQWLRMNLAMQDKSIEPTETKNNTEKSVKINPMPKLPPDSPPRIEMKPIPKTTKRR